MTNIYLAGKIGHTDWRHGVFGMRGLDEEEARNWSPQPTSFEGVQYVGPFFVGCDHGCAHGSDAHGQGGGCLGPGHREQTARDCLAQVRAADLVYAWLDELTPNPTHSSAYGTLVEIGYALALGKPVVVAATRAPLDPESPGVAVDRYPIDDLWFAWTLATARLTAATPLRGLEHVLNNRQNYLSGFQPLGL